MIDKIKVLIVEDHDLVSEGLVDMLESSSLNTEIDICSSADDAFARIQKNDFDIVLLDIILKSDINESVLLDGDDLLRELNRLPLKPKILILSKIDSLSMLDYIINNLNADGFILKSRTSLSEVIPAIEILLNGGNYFSKSIKRKFQFNDSFLDIDFIDRFILSSLSMGIKQGELPEHLRQRDLVITLSAIEKRLKKMKMRFDVITTIQLVSTAIKEGIIDS